MPIIAVEHSDAAGFEPEKYFGLRIGDRLERGKKTEMSGLDRRDDRDVRPHNSGKNAYFARMVHAELKNPVSGSGRRPGQRQRRAPVIIEAACRGKSRAASGESKAQRLFGAGLADTAGNRNHPGARAPARCGTECRKSGERVGYAQQRCGHR